MDKYYTVRTKQEPDIGWLMQKPVNKQTIYCSHTQNSASIKGYQLNISTYCSDNWDESKNITDSRNNIMEKKTMMFCQGKIIQMAGLTI